MSNKSQPGDRTGFVGMVLWKLLSCEVRIRLLLMEYKPIKSVFYKLLKEMLYMLCAYVIFIPLKNRLLARANKTIISSSNTHIMAQTTLSRLRYVYGDVQCSHVEKVRYDYD